MNFEIDFEQIKHMTIDDLVLIAYLCDHSLRIDFE